MEKLAISIKIILFVVVICLTYSCDPLRDPALPPPSSQFAVQSIIFGVSAEVHGNINNSTLNFPASTTTVYYLVEFTIPSERRLRIRKIWYNNNNPSTNLFSSIQIIEGNDERIFGKWERFDTTPLNGGDYGLIIEVAGAAGYSEIGLSPIFNIQSNK